MQLEIFRARALCWAAVALAGLGFAATSTAAEPVRGEPPPQAPAAAAAKPRGAQHKQIDINNASRAELKTLPGIGDAEAKKIVAGRPWLTKADLVTKNVISEGTYVAIKRQIVVARPRPAKKQ